MKLTGKRILAAFLAIVMLFALLPGRAAVSAEPTGITVKYDYKAALSRYVAANSLGSLGNSMNAPFADVFSKENTLGFFSFGASSRTGFAGGNIKVNWGDIQIFGGQWLSFEVNVPADGSYHFTQSFKGSASDTWNTDTSVYISSTKPAGTDTFGTLVGTYNSKTDGGSSQVFDKQISAAPVAMTAGKWYVTYAPAGGSGVCTFVNGLTLTSGDGSGTALMTAELKTDKTEFKAGETLQLSMEGYLSDGTATTAAAATYESSDPSIATVSDSGLVTGVAEGTTTITAKFTGSELEDTVDLTIHPSDAVVLPDTNIAIKYDINGIMKAYGKTDGNTTGNNMVGSLSEVYTYASTHGFFAYAGGSATDFSSNVATSGIRNNYGDFQLYKNNWVTFKIKVPVDGNYTFEQTAKGMTRDAENVDVTVYVSSTKPDSLEMAKSGTEVGVFNCNKDCVTNNKAFTKQLNTAAIPLEKGEYYVTYSVGSQNTGALIQYLTLKSGDGSGTALMTAELKAEGSEVEAGKTLQLSVDAYLSDGTATTTAAANYESSDPSIATVSGSGLVTGVAEGTATIKATVSLGEDSVTDEVTVTVIPKAVDGVESSGITVYYNIYETLLQLAGADVKLSAEELAGADYAATNGFWKMVDSSGILNKYPQNTGIALPQGKSIQVEVYVPKAGRYELSVGYRNGKDTGSEVTVLDGEGKRIGSYTTLTLPEGSKQQPVVTKVGSIAFDAPGKYTLCFQAGATGRNGAVGSITLNGGDGFMLLGSISPKAASIAVGETTRIQTDTAYRTDTALAVSPSDLTFRSTAPSVAEVAGNVITGKGVGTATVKATAQGSVNTLETGITVTEPVVTEGFKIIYGFEPAHEVGITNAKYSHTNGFWEFVKTNNTKRLTVQGDASAYGTSGYQLEQNSGYVILKIKVPKAGRYDVKLNGVWKRAAAIGNTDIYIMNANGYTGENALFTEANKVGSVDCTAAENGYSGGVEPVASDVYFAEDEYIVGYKGNAYYMGIGPLLLDGGDKTVLIGTFLTAEKTELMVGQTVQTAVKTYFSDGSLAQGAAVTYTSSDNDVATVNNSGRITALASGQVEIKAAVNAGGETSEATLKLWVSPNTVSGVAVQYNFVDYLYANLRGSDGKITDLANDSVKYKDTNGFWKMVDASGLTYNGKSFITGVNGGIQLVKNKDLVVGVYVPVAGDYSLRVSWVNTALTGLPVTVSYAREGSEDWQELGTYQTETAASTTAAEKAFAYTRFEQGYYKLKFTAKQGTGGNCGEVGNFRLYGGDGTALMMPELRITDRKIQVTNAYMSDGSPADLTKARITYSGNNPAVAVVDSESGGIEVKALGKVTFTAKVSLAPVELELSAEHEITALPEPPLPFTGEVLRYAFYNIGTWEDVGNKKENLKGIDYTHTGNWGYFGVSQEKATVDGKQLYGEAVAFTRLKLLMDQKHWVALKIQVPQDGTYFASLESSKNNGEDAEGELYLIPMDRKEDIAGALTEEHLLGKVSYKDEKVSGAAVIVDDFYDLELKKGEYLLVFRRTGGGVNTTPRAFILDSVNSLKRISADAEKTDLTVSANGGEKTKITYSAWRLDGTRLEEGAYSVSITSSDPGVLDVTGNGAVTAISEGTATVTVTLSDKYGSRTRYIVFTVKDVSQVKEAVLDAPSVIYTRDNFTLVWTAVLESGNRMGIPTADITYTLVCDPEGAGSVEDGVLYAKKAGKATLKASTVFRGKELTAQCDIEILHDDGKTEATYYTAEMRQNVLENVQKYDWAWKSAQSYKEKADEIFNNIDIWYDTIMGEGVPRGRQVGAKSDPEYNLCRYCGANVVAMGGGSGAGGWIVDPVEHRWKIQCPNCERLFPTNDFESFYKLGLDAHGYFTRERALMEHHKLFVCANGESCTHEAIPVSRQGTVEYNQFYGYGKGYLKNDSCPELYTAGSSCYNQDPSPNHSGETVDGLTWGVDDGWGYLPGRTYASNGVEERHTYIALYSYEAMRDVILDIIPRLSNAYLTTAYSKYGVASAKLVDRIADFYPSYEWHQYVDKFFCTDGGSGYGLIFGRIDDCDAARILAQAADAFYPVLENRELISYLSEKAEKYDLENKKDSAYDIWKNWEKNLLEEIFVEAQKGNLWGNFGQVQYAVASAAVVLDKEPETEAMIKWLYQNTEAPSGGRGATGGNLSVQLLNVVDRDGMGNEAAPNYNLTWVTQLYGTAEALAKYKGVNAAKYDLFQNPKFIKMCSAITPLVLTGNHIAQIGDTGDVASLTLFGGASANARYLAILKGTDAEKELARYIYIQNGYKTDGLHYDMYTKDPESLQSEIRAIVNGEDASRTVSEMMPCYGFAVLRDGVALKDVTWRLNTQRDFWMYYGRNGGHGHNDTLNIGIEAYGINLSPEMAYPQNTGTDPNRLQWVSAKIAHNTVVVDEKNDDKTIVHGTPLHFDDSGKVKVMDVDAADVNSATSVYRRTVVMVQVDNNVSYGVDFFRVVGGDTHTYSFHAQSQEATAVQGLTMTKDPGYPNASYASGIDTKDYDKDGDTAEWMNVPFGQDPNSPATWSYETVYPRGYTWMKKVRRDTEPENNFSVDFAIQDYRNSVNANWGIHLRMTQLNDFIADEVAIVGGMVPVKKANKPITDQTDTLEYVLVQRKGENLDSLFTTVYEPYKVYRYLDTIEAVEVTVADGKEAAGDTVKAVKVTHTEGRTDYIVYATNNTVTYEVDGLFQFRGFVGVYSVDEHYNVLFTYVNDGDIVGEPTGRSGCYEGTVVNFEKSLSVKNYIDVKFSGAVAAKNLVGKFIRVANDGVHNGVYEVVAVEEQPNADGSLRLYTGMVTLIRSLRDASNESKGYIYNIAGGQRVTVPRGYLQDNTPERLEYKAGVTTTVEKAAIGDEILVTVNVSHPQETNITAAELKIRYDSRTLAFNWLGSQLGTARVKMENGIITISDYGINKELGQGQYVLKFRTRAWGYANVDILKASFSSASRGVTVWELEKAYLTEGVEFFVYPDNPVGSEKPEETTEPVQPTETTEPTQTTQPAEPVPGDDGQDRFPWWIVIPPIIAGVGFYLWYHWYKKKRKRE